MCKGILDGPRSSEPEKTKVYKTIIVYLLYPQGVIIRFHSKEKEACMMGYGYWAGILSAASLACIWKSKAGAYGGRREYHCGSARV